MYNSIEQLILSQWTNFPFINIFQIFSCPRHKAIGQKNPSHDLKQIVGDILISKSVVKYNRDQSWRDCEADGVDNNINLVVTRRDPHHPY